MICQTLTVLGQLYTGNCKSEFEKYLAILRRQKRIHSQKEAFIRKCSEQFLKIHGRETVMESFISTVTACKFPEEDLHHRNSPMAFAKYSVCNKMAYASTQVRQNPNNRLVTVSSCHVTYAFQRESTLCSCLNVKELLA